MNPNFSLLIPHSSPFELIRLGGTGDGAYLIPNDLEGIDACFSPGVNNAKEFEDELTTQHGIRCHLCDFSSDLEKFRTPLIPEMQTFTKKWLDVDGGQASMSLQEWVEEYSPDASKDLILQMDIEGAEYRNLLATESSTLKRFRIMVIELHRLNAFKNPQSVAKDLGALLSKLDQTHVPVHAHPNNCCGSVVDAETGLTIPVVIEVTHLRRDRLTNNNALPIQPQLPHPLDISWNIRRKPPLHLNEKWLNGGKRSLESEIKVLRDELDFANWERTERQASDSQALEEIIDAYRSSIINLSDKQQIQSVLNDPGLSTEEHTDLALGKHYTLSKPYGSYPAAGIVREDPTFFFHTALARNQSITIDLGESFSLNHLVIGNRTDTCQYRARSLFCAIHDTKSHALADALPVITTDAFLNVGGAKSFTPLFGKRGRYLTIFSPIHTALHFSSIRVF